MTISFFRALSTTTVSTTKVVSEIAQFTRRYFSAAPTVFNTAEAKKELYNKTYQSWNKVFKEEDAFVGYIEFHLFGFEVEDLPRDLKKIMQDEELLIGNKLTDIARDVFFDNFELNSDLSAIRRKAPTEATMLLKNNM